MNMSINTTVNSVDAKDAGCIAVKTDIAMLKMIQVCDSLFPIGAFTLSNGLETFVCEGRLAGDAELEEYVQSFLQILPYNDLGVMMLSYQHGNEWEYITQLDRLSLALKAPMEVRAGAEKLCSRFIKIRREIGDCEAVERYGRLIAEEKCLGSYAVAVGLFAKGTGLPMKESGLIYAHSLVAAIVTNGVKTIPLSQMSGQRILGRAQEKIAECVEIAGNISIDELGVGGTQFDIEAMRHENLYSRLYIS